VERVHVVCCISSMAMYGTRKIAGQPPKMLT
jgi:hypothetical protein